LLHCSATPRSGTDITTFGEGEKFRMWAVAQALATYYTVFC
jgi:hypothetical protein